MEYQNRRYLSLLGVSNNIDICPSLETNITTDYLVVGGGVAGLHAAQALLEKKCSVTLIEKSICGGGMSGRSGGFLTPDSELGLRQIEARYSTDLARKIWDYGVDGQQRIVENATKYSLHCDLRQEDSLLLGLGKKGKKAVLGEFFDRKLFGLQAEVALADSNVLENKELKKHNMGIGYTAGVRYTDCYALNPMQYCQELKRKLIKQGLSVYEFTELHQLGATYAKTNLGSVSFKKAIICAGKADETIFPGYAKRTYGIQNYITISEPVHPSQLRKMMPSGECMCRDTDLVFTYYRLTGERRIVLGGGTPFSSFQPRDILHKYTISSVITGFKKRFPILKQVEFPYYRSGRIQATKDLMPLIGPSDTWSNHIRVQGAVGLPRAAACGHFATELMHREADPELERIFSYHRTFALPRTTNHLLLKPFLFGISNAKAMGIF